MRKTLGRFLVAAGTLFLTQAAFAQDACPVTDINGDGVTDALIIATPHVARHALAPADEFLIVATDGVWGVLDDAAACARSRFEFGS